MSDLKLPGDDKKKKTTAGPMRIVLWVAVGGFALVEIITGIVGLITKAQ